jgi:hypothetical protein
VISVDIELALVGLTAMLEPATLLSSVLALVIGDRPLRTGSLFYVGGLGVTLLIGVIAALVVGNVAASSTSTPKTWVSVVTTLAGTLVLGYAVWLLLHRRTGRDQMGSVAERMNKVASAPAPAIIAAGAALANPGIFMLLAAKSISQLDPSTAQYFLDWALFAIVALLPLAAALLMLLIAPGFTEPRLITARGWVERHGRTIIAVVLLGLAASLLRDGITGLTSV